MSQSFKFLIQTGDFNIFVLHVCVKHFQIKSSFLAKRIVLAGI